MISSTCLGFVGLDVRGYNDEILAALAAENELAECLVFTRASARDPIIPKDIDVDVRLRASIAQRGRPEAIPKTDPREANAQVAVIAGGFTNDTSEKAFETKSRGDATLKLGVSQRLLPLCGRKQQ